MQSPGRCGDWLAPPPSPPRAHAPNRHERGAGTSTRPLAGTCTWPSAGTFSWPRTRRMRDADLRCGIVTHPDRPDLPRFHRVRHGTHEGGDRDATGRKVVLIQIDAARRSRARLWCSASGSASALDRQPGGNLVAITTLVPSASSPNRCSDAPPLYIAAVSKKFAPADRLASKASCSSSGPAVPPYASLAGPHRLRPEGLPQVIAPTPSLGTSRSLRPRGTRSIIHLPSLATACP
jgi:hypothetical protein